MGLHMPCIDYIVQFDHQEIVLFELAPHLDEAAQVAE
jgi:hypothetical protein